MTQPRPSRTARWVIGLSLTAVLALIAVGCGLIALVAVAGNAVAGSMDDDQLDSRATATVLDVDAYSWDDRSVPLTSSWAENGGYATIDIDFMANGEHEVTTIDWPVNRALPVEGKQLKIAYRFQDPEDGPELAPAGTDAAPVPSPFAGPASDPPSWPGSTAVITGLLALLTLIGTIFWAVSAQPATPRAKAPGGLDWNQPPPAWPQSPVAVPVIAPHPSAEAKPQLTDTLPPAASQLSSSPVQVTNPPPPPGLVPPN